MTWLTWLTWFLVFGFVVEHGMGRDYVAVPANERLSNRSAPHRR